MTNVLEVRNLTKTFPAGRSLPWQPASAVSAVDDVSFEVRADEVLGLVGESGSGKSTAARCIVQLPRPTGGSVRLLGQELTQLRGGSLRRARRTVQYVFQDPTGALDPRWSALDLVAEPLRIQGVAAARRRELAAGLLERVGLQPSTFGSRRPAELSGGQNQRVAIARALAARPALLIYDEPVSSLDVSIRAQVLNLIEDLREQFKPSSIFIGHDLSIVKHVSDRIAVMFLGRLCEIGPAEAVHRSPAHPYTAALLQSVPPIDPRLKNSWTRPRLAGEPPSSLTPPSGCRFRTLCPHAQERCAMERPLMQPVGADHLVACHFPLTTATTVEAAARQRAIR